MAWREIKSNPGVTVIRGLARFRMLFSPDYWIVRHAVKARYGPLSVGLLFFITLVCFGSYWLLAGFTIRGFVEPNALNRYHWFPLIVTLALMIGPLLTVARGRYHYPLLVLLLPFAAAGVQRLMAPISRWRFLVGIVAFVAIVAVSASAIPIVCRWSLRPSFHYWQALSYLPFECADEIPFEDVVVLRAADGPPFLERYKVLFPDGQGRILFSDERLIAVEFVTVKPPGPSKFYLVDSTSGRRTTVDPIRPSHWQKWQPTKLPGVDVMWSGPWP